MRIYTIISLLLLLSIASFKFVISNEVKSLNKQIAIINKDLNIIKEDLAMLNAEWGYISSPENIKRLAKYLQYETASDYNVISEEQLYIFNPDYNNDFARR